MMKTFSQLATAGLLVMSMFTGVPSASAEVFNARGSLGYAFVDSKPRVDTVRDRRRHRHAHRPQHYNDRRGHRDGRRNGYVDRDRRHHHNRDRRGNRGYYSFYGDQVYHRRDRRPSAFSRVTPAPTYNSVQPRYVTPLYVTPQ